MNWPIYIINLSENIIRRKQSEIQFSRMNISYEIINAINGNNLTKLEINKVYKDRWHKSPYKLTPFEIGCYLTHKKLWEKIVDKKYDGAFIFEDDFIACANLRKVLEELKKNSNWEMIKLYSYDFIDSCDLIKYNLIENYSIVKTIQPPLCTLGYGITKNSALKILRKRKTFSRAIDEDILRFWETDIKCDVLIPSVLTEGIQTSSIGTIREQRNQCNKDTKNIIRKKLTMICYKYKFNKFNKNYNIIILIFIFIKKFFSSSSSFSLPR